MTTKYPKLIKNSNFSQILLGIPSVISEVFMPGILTVGILIGCSNQKLTSKSPPEKVTPSSQSEHASGSYVPADSALKSTSDGKATESLKKPSDSAENKDAGSMLPGPTTDQKELLLVKPDVTAPPKKVVVGKVTVVEAESTGVGIVQKDAHASGGAFVSGSHSQWDWIFKSPVPPGDTSLSVWARGKNMTVESKNADGVSLGHGWFSENNFTWTLLGRFSRAQLAGILQLTNVKNPNWDDVNSGIDEVIFAENEAFNPQSEMVTTAADFQKAPLGKANKKSYGNNTFALVEQNYTGPDFGKKFIESMVGFGRMHSDLFYDWLAADKRSYDAGKIKARYYQTPWPKDFTILQGIQGFPSGFATRSGEPRLLAPSEFDAYAAFAASLVKILNIDQKRKVEYFEPGNELDDAYKDSPNRRELYEIWLRSAKAMKAVDPAIKLAGCAFTWDNDALIQEFVNYSSATGKVADYLDVLTFHRYVGGKTNTMSSESLFDWADKFRDMGVRIRGMVKNVLGAKPFEVHLNEYAISYDANPQNEERQKNWIGASFYGQIMANYAIEGMGANAWNFKDGWNGSLDNNGTTARPTFYVNKWFNSYLVGDIYSVANNSSQGNIFSMGVKSESSQALLFINRSSSAQSILLQQGIPSTAKVLINDATGQREVALSEVISADRSVSLGAFGTMIVVF